MLTEARAALAVHVQRDLQPPLHRAVEWLFIIVSVETP